MNVNSNTKNKNLKYDTPHKNHIKIDRKDIKMEKNNIPLETKSEDVPNTNNRITTILVDTCAFRDANSDFIGVNSMLLPSFFSSIQDKEMLLLTHPILEKELEKHIEDSGLYKDYQNLLSHLNKCRDVLEYANCNNIELFEKIAEYDIKKQTYDAYVDYYKDAVRLNYPNPELIFDLYFSSKPPFAIAGKKKSEFTDAFVIESAKQYIEEHPNDILLAVSKDNDWKNSFADLDEVIMCESIDEAIKKINSIESILSDSMLSEIFHGAYDEIISKAEFYVDGECYELDDYEFIEDMEIDSVEVKEVDDLFTPLKISREMILIKTVATISVSGHGEIFDEDRSIWDSEDKEYIVKEYSDLAFTNGEAEVECEIRIIFDFDDPKNSAEVDSFKLNSRGNILISNYKEDLLPIDEDEMAIRCLREDKGYSRRYK